MKTMNKNNEKIALTDIKVSHKASMVKQSGKQRNQRDKIESPEIDPYKEFLETEKTI